PGAARGPALPTRLIAQVAEEVAAGVDDQDIALVAEGLAIGVEAAGKGVELGILVKGLGVHGGGRGVAETADLLRLPVGVGFDNGLLAVGVGADFYALLVALGAEFPGFLLPLRRHPPEYLVADFIGQIDLAHPDIDDLYAQ